MEKAFLPPSETAATPETSQAAYVRSLQEYYESIPDLSSYKSRDLPEHKVISLEYYCNNYHNFLGLTPQPPLRRPDIVDPDFCHSAQKLSHDATRTPPHINWYRVGRNEEDLFDSEITHASRKWSIFYVEHMKQRRGFHLQFMQALLDKNDINFDSLEVLEIPSGPRHLDHLKDQSANSPDLYDKTNWFAASVMSALALPPEHCDAAMKHHAVKLLAEHADFSNKHSFNFLEVENDAVLRLPWSMRVGDEFHQVSNLAWRDNFNIRHFIGRDGGINPAARDRLLNERPHDYVQLRIMQLFDKSQPDKRAVLQDLAGLISMPEVHTILFSEKASFVTVHSEIDLSEYPPQPESLSQLLGVTK